MRVGIASCVIDPSEFFVPSTFLIVIGLVRVRVGMLYFFTTCECMRELMAPESIRALTFTGFGSSILIGRNNDLFCS